MTKRWRSERKRDSFYRAAKSQGYRSRAAFKLLQMQDRFHLIRAGDTVVDLGAAPGGWSQVARDLAGPEGRVLALDLQPLRPLDGVEVLRGDLTSEEVMRVALAKLGGPADVVLSDMAPDMSGTYSLDHARSIHLCRQALAFASTALRPGGTFLVKAFEGDLYPDFLDALRESFQTVKAHRPVASRKQSSEVYVVCQGFRG